MQHFSGFTDEGPSIAERVIRTIRHLLKKPVFKKGNANWLSKLSSFVKKHNITIHSSKKLTPKQAFKKANEKDVYTNLPDRKKS